MKTFAIKNGDLTLTSGAFTLLGGRDKIKQDLAVAVREPLGCDRFHPYWGSTLPDIVGGISSVDTQGLIQAEINRVIRNYTSIQADLIQADLTNRRKPLFVNDEIVSSVDAIHVVQREDTFFVRVVLTTVAGKSVTLVTSVGA